MYPSLCNGSAGFSWLNVTVLVRAAVSETGVDQVVEAKQTFTFKSDIFVVAVQGVQIQFMMHFF